MCRAVNFVPSYVMLSYVVLRYSMMSCLLRFDCYLQNETADLVFAVLYCPLLCYAVLCSALLQLDIHFKWLHLTELRTFL